jgi:dihydroneopterin triphosphate diphosphatase
MKIPISVLVVIYTAKREVLLLERSDHPGYWQSVTGSLDSIDESLVSAATRELFEETGINVAELPSGSLMSMDHSVEYEIYPEWRYRYPNGITQNKEHWFKLYLPDRVSIRLAEREHLAYRWESLELASQLCFSPSNQQAIQRINFN